MRLVIQRISSGSVTIGQTVVGSAGTGLCIFVGVKNGDSERDSQHLIEKLIHLRVFEDANGKMNRSLLEINGEILLISEFTLYGDLSKGHRPSFSAAAPANEAERLYNHFVEGLKQTGIKVETGKFRAHMTVNITNDGPVTFILES
jgi:D-tyrosyl-tRNA(Tyr) deacylase